MVGANIIKYFLLIVPFFFAITIPVACINDMDDIETTPNSTPPSIPPTTVEGVDETPNYIDHYYNSTSDAFPPVQPQYNCEENICVSKCCPNGQLFDYETRSCSNVEDSNTSDWKPKFEAELGDKLLLISKIPSLPREEKNESYVCKMHNNEKFTLKEDGTVSLTGREASISHDFYCIDNIYHNGCLSVVAVLCYDDSDAESAATGAADKFLLGGFCISCISLALLLLMHCKGSTFKRDLQAKCTISSCISLLFRFSYRVLDDVVDVNAMWGNFLWLFFLLSFYFWLNVTCYEISRIIRGTVKMQSYRDLMENESRRFLCYCAYAWGLPLLVCLVIFTLEYLEVVKKEDYMPGYVLITIVFSLLVANALLMAHTTYLVNRDKFACLRCKAGKNTSPQLRTHNSKGYLVRFKQQLMIYSLYIFLWCLQLISGFWGGSRIISVIVSLQGVFLFIIVV